MKLTWLHNEIVHQSISFNGRIFPSGTPAIPAHSSGALYGKGVFSTVAVYHAEPFLFELHWKRLSNHAGRLGIDIAGLSGEVIKDWLSELIAENAVSNGRARITFIDSSPAAFWFGEHQERASVLMNTAPPRDRPSQFRLSLSDHTVNSASPLSGIKSCNYLDPLMSLEKARSLGFDEAIRLNERGEVVSGCMANVFWSAGGKLFTPSLTTGCLPGTTREFILQNTDCKEVVAGIEELRGAEQIFLSSAGIGVIQAAEFEAQPLGERGHPVLHLLPTAG